MLKSIINGTVSFILLSIAYASNWIAGFYILGGPDGRFLSTESFLYGGPALAIAIILILFNSKLNPKNYNNTSAVVINYVPIIVVIINWFLCFISHSLSFYVWLFGVPTATVASIVLADVFCSRLTGTR